MLPEAGLRTRWGRLFSHCLPLPNPASKEGHTAEAKSRPN